MNERLQNGLAGVGKFYSSLTARQKQFGGLALAVMAIAALASTVISQQDPYETLFSDLQPEESRLITQKLAEERVPYKATPSGSEVMVPRSQVHTARMGLAKAGLPGQDVVGLEKFDASTLGMSSYVQRIQYVRAVQGELTRTIQRLDSVKRARVHISMPPKKTFIEEEDPPKASVVLELKRGQKPSKAEVGGIAHLVASAVEGLKVSQVTIVDTHGNFLHRPEENGQNSSIPTALLEMQRNIESEYERRVEDILSPVIGVGKVRAKVAVEVDPSRVNTTEETFDADKAAVKQKVTNDETVVGSKPNPMGIPGSRSNLPGAEAQSPSVPMANTRSDKNVKNESYAIPRKIQVTDKPSGSLKRLTVAVIVDGNYNKVNGVEEFVPRNEQELNRIKELVANVVGFDEQRRDSITVSSLPFRETEIIPDVEAPTAVIWYKQPLWLGIGGASGLALLIGMFLLLKLMGRKKTVKVAAMEQQIEKGPKTVAELEAMNANTSATGQVAGATQAETNEALLAAQAKQLGSAIEQSTIDAQSGDVLEPADKKEQADLKKKILEKLDSVPKKGIAILEEWLGQTGTKRVEIEDLEPPLEYEAA